MDLEVFKTEIVLKNNRKLTLLVDLQLDSGEEGMGVGERKIEYKRN